MDRKTATVDSGSCATPPDSKPKTVSLVAHLFGIGLLHGVALLFASVNLDSGFMFRAVGAGVLVFWAIVATSLLRCRFRLGEREKYVLINHWLAVTLGGILLYLIEFIVAVMVMTLLDVD